MSSFRGGPMHYVHYGGEGQVVVALLGYVQNARALNRVGQALVPHFEAGQSRGLGLAQCQLNQVTVWGDDRERRSEP